MKKLLCFCCGLLVATVGVRATPVFSDNFDSYTPGNLVGQDGWTITGTSTVNLLQVAGGKVSLMTTGQDAYSALPGGPITLNDGDNFYIGLTLNVSAAQAAGDYFLHFSNPLGTTSFFYDRFYVQSSGAGYVLGWAETSSGTPATTYGSTVLNFGTDYRVVVAYHDVAGALNDTGALYVNPFTDPNVELNNTAYVTRTWSTPTAENETIAALNLRQGTAANAPTLTLDDLNASTTFSDVTTFTAVPEPTTLSLLGGFGLLALLISRRRR